MRRSVRLQTQGRARGQEEPAPRRPEKRHGDATEEARFLATLKEANMPAELVQTVQNNVSALDEAMEVLRSSGKRASKQEIRCVLIAANVAQRLKDPANAKKVLHPQSEAEVEIARDVAAALDGYALNSMESSERNQVEDLLYRYNLAIDTSRGLEYKCNFKPIFVPGVKTLTQSELESFLENNKVHHLAIFSVERKPEGMACFFVEDLFALLKIKSNSPTNADVHKFREEYWEMANVEAGGVTLTAEDCMNAIEWHAAYTQLKDLLKNEIDADKYAGLLKVSSAIVPTHRLSRWRSVKNFISRQVRNMWGLIGGKLAWDLISNSFCVAVLTFGCFASPRAFSEAALSALMTYLKGFLMCSVYGFVNFIYNTFAGNIFKTVMNMFTSVLKQLGFEDLVTYAASWLEAIKPHSQIAKTVAASTAFVLSTLLKKLIIGGLMAGFTYVSGVSTVGLAFFSASTLVPLAIGTSIVAYTAYHGNTEMPQALSYLDPDMGFFGVLLATVSAGAVCEVVRLVAGRKAARVCNARISKTVENMLQSAIVYSICDLLLLLVRVVKGQNFLAEYFGETRCERLLSGLVNKDKERKLFLAAFKTAKLEAQKAALNEQIAGQEYDVQLMKLASLMQLNTDPTQVFDLNKDPNIKKDTALQTAFTNLIQCDTNYKNAQEVLIKMNESLKFAAEKAAKSYKPFKMYTRVDLNKISPLQLIINKTETELKPLAEQPLKLPNTNPTSNNATEQNNIEPSNGINATNNVLDPQATLLLNQSNTNSRSNNETLQDRTRNTTEQNAMCEQPLNAINAKQPVLDRQTNTLHAIPEKHQEKKPIVDERTGMTFAALKNEAAENLLQDHRWVLWRNQGKDMIISPEWTGDEHLVEKIVTLAIQNPEKALELPKHDHGFFSFRREGFLYFGDKTCEEWNHVLKKETGNGVCD